MAWCALVRKWNDERKMYDSLTLRIEDTQEPGCLIRLYEKETAVAEALAETPQLAMAKALDLARAHLNTSLSSDDLRWVQVG